MSEPEQPKHPFVIEKSDIEYRFFVSPQAAGFWIIGGEPGLRVAVTKRPTDQQIKNTTEMFGWEWREA